MDSPVISPAEMRAAEQAAFERGVCAARLMEMAGKAVARSVSDIFPRPARALVFAGKGNNAGDALVAAACLKRAGWLVDVHLAYPENESNDLLRQHIAAFRDTPPHASPDCDRRLIIIDGLLGLGSKPPLREPVLNHCREINRLRRSAGAFVFAVDQPSGLDAENGGADADCVVADFTVAIGAAKRGLLADRALDVVGRLEVVSLEGLTFPLREETIATPPSLAGLIPRRKFGAYKNHFGRVGIVAGSRGFTGAARLCTEGALKAGAGLVHLFVPEEIYPVVATAAPAEAMVSPFKFYVKLAEEAIDVWAIGPGLGRTRQAQVRRFIRENKKPMIVDADALNILASQISVLRKGAGPRLLTPHPGEMKRLVPEAVGSRADIARGFASEYPVTLLLKGSRTLIAEGTRLSYNTTGNPGMATGGMGDVLTGVLAALLAQGLDPFDAARTGAWLCGRAAEIARFRGRQSEQSLLPRDVICELGAAFEDLQKAPL